ncbi:MAG TPA: FixH family protein [Vicinamibacterales bacterium]|nr:FixH family protein [Vicinamibacterales bacterium]
MAPPPEEFLNKSSGRRCAIAAIALLSLVSCRGPATTDSDMIELQRVRSNGVDVVLLSNDGTLSHGKDTFTVEFRRGDQLVDVGTVKAGATMPMAGLPDMLGSVFLEPGDAPGRYTAETDLGMSGGWKLKLDWDGPAGRGTAAFDVTLD